jgi:molybdate/tungstate transport system substrate-binding protein
MVIAYSPKSKFVPDFEAARGKKPGTGVADPGLRFGRTDPATDPQGQTSFSHAAGADFYRSGLADQILRRLSNPQQIFTEPRCCRVWKPGQIDASRLSERDALRTICRSSLPDEINLSNPEMSRVVQKGAVQHPRWPAARATLNTQPLVFYAAVLKDSKQPALAEKFVQFTAKPQKARSYWTMAVQPAQKKGRA